MPNLDAVIQKAKLNGRPVACGDVCICVVFIRRSQALTADSIMHRRVCKIVSFYELVCGNEPQIFAEVNVIDTIDTIQSLYVVNASALSQPDVENTTVFHVDNVTTKAHVAPHFDNAEYVCIIPMWETR